MNILYSAIKINSSFAIGVYVCLLLLQPKLHDKGKGKGHPGTGRGGPRGSG
jgi:hypothetical protein